MDFEDVATSQIGKIVAFVLTPILLPTATAVAAWAQDAIGIDLDGGALTAYVVAVAVGIAAVSATWLFNRGKWEVGKAELDKLYELGRAELDRNAAVSGPGKPGV